MTEPSPDSRQQAALPTRPGGGRDALLVFCGTLAAASVGLNLALTMAPERFGLRAGSEALPPTSTTGLGDEAGNGRALPPALVPRVRLEEDDVSFSAPRAAVERATADATLPEVIFRDAEPSVVHVTTVSNRNGRAARRSDVSGVGSGLVWDRDGHIVTSKHVVDNIHIDGVTVTLFNGAKYAAKLVGVDVRNDLAVIRIDAPAEFLTPVRLGTSADLVVGMTVFSVACPYGLDPCLTTGHISGLGRSIQSTTDQELSGVIQTDAMLDRGSSGGALIDDQGRVVGLNAAIHQDYFRYGGVGFAVAIDVVREEVPEIIRSGVRWYRRFGFTTVGEPRNRSYLDDALASGSGPDGAQEGGALTVAAVPANGLVVETVLDGSIASRSGLRGMQRQTYEDIVVRDIIISAGGRPVVTTEDLELAIHDLDPGQPLLLEVARPDGIAQVELAP